MDRDTKILVVIMVVLLITSISFAYYRFFITKDYEIVIPEDTQEQEEDLGQ